MLSGRSKVVLWNWDTSRESDSNDHHDTEKVGDYAMTVLETREKIIEKDIMDISNGCSSIQS